MNIHDKYKVTQQLGNEVYQLHCDFLASTSDKDKLVILEELESKIKTRNRLLRELDKELML